MLSSFSGEEDDNVSIISQEKDATLDISQLDALTRAQTLQLDGAVAHNRAKIFMARSMVSENSMMISQNYSAAFMVNRRIANENMDAMFRVRCGIIQCLPVEDELSFQFREAQLNSMKIDFLTFRSKADANATRITSDLAELAATSVEINKTISEANEEIRQYNLRMMQENAHLFERLRAELRAVSVESNLALLQSNSEKLRDLSLHSNTTAASIDRLLLATEQTRVAIAANSEAIAHHRQELINGNDDIAENRSTVAAKIMLRGGRSDDHDDTTDLYHAVNVQIMDRGGQALGEQGRSHNRTTGEDNAELVSVNSRTSTRSKRTPSTVIPPFGRVSHGVKAAGRTPPKPTWKGSPVASSKTSKTHHLVPPLPLHPSSPPPSPLYPSSPSTPGAGKGHTEEAGEPAGLGAPAGPPVGRAAVPIQRPSWPLSRTQPATSSDSNGSANIHHHTNHPVHHHDSNHGASQIASQNASHNGILSHGVSTSISDDSQTRAKPLLPQVRDLLAEPPVFADELRAMAGIAVSSSAQRRLHTAHSTSRLGAQPQPDTHPNSNFNTHTVTHIHSHSDPHAEPHPHTHRGARLISHSDDPPSAHRASRQRVVSPSRASTIATATATATAVNPSQPSTREDRSNNAPAMDEEDSTSRRRRKSAADLSDRARRDNWKDKVTYLVNEDAFLIRL